VDRSAFDRELDAAKADADKFSSKPIKATVTADGTQAKATLDDLTARADKLSGKAGTIKISADASQANTEMDKTSAKADALGKKDPTITVKADTAQANADLDKTAAKADALGRKTETVTVRANTSDATKQVDTLSKKLTNLSDQLKDKSGPAWLGPAILALPGLTSLLGVAAGAAAGLGGTFVAAGGALAAFGAVAKPVLTDAQTAATAAQSAQDAYTASVQKTTGQYQIAMAAATTRAQQRAAFAAEQKGFAADRLAETQALSKAYAGLSPQQIELSKQLGDMATAWQKVQAAETPVVAGALTPWLQTVTPLLKDLPPIIAAVAPVIHDLGVKINDVVTSPGFQSFVSFIAGTGSAALNAIGSTIVDLIDSFIILLPKFTPLIDEATAGIANFGARVLAWAQSKQASDDITGFLDWFNKNGPIVRTLIDNIGGALKALSPGLTTGGALEIQVLSGFLGWIAKLPPSFAKPITEVTGALLLASKLGVLKLGVNIVSTGGKLLDLLTGAGKTSTINVASAGMTSAADTMLLASQNMLKAAGLEDTAGAGGGAGVKAGEGAAGGAAGLAGGLLSVAALAAVALVVLDQIKVPGGGSVLRPKQSDLGVGGTWWNDAGSALGDKPQTGKVPGGAVAGGPSQLAPLASASQQGEPDFTKWWQDFDRDVVQKVAAWVTTTVPQTFTRAIPGWFANIWGDFTRAVVSPVANWVTQSLPAAFTRSVPGWFTAVWQDFNRDVVQKIANWVTQSLPHFFTDTVPHWFDLAVGAFTGKVITPVRTFITATIPGFFTATIPHWFDIAVTWLTSKVINPVKTFVLTTLPGFFTSTIPHWFDIAVTWLTSKVITPVKTFVLTTLPGFFTSTIPHWFDIAVTWLTSKVITPARTFVLTTLPGFFTQTIPHWFDIAVTWLTSKVITPVKTFVLTTLPGFFTSTIPHWFDSVGTWFTSKVINPVTSFITSIPGRIASGFKSGINTVIGFVDKVLSAVHLPTIPKLAKGGMVPGGYSREDNQLVWMRSGEGVLQPGAVAALGGPAFIDAANRAYGDVPVGSSPAGHFAAGGIPGLGVVGDVAHAVTGAAKSALGDVTSLLKSGFRFAFDHLWSGVVSPVLGTVSSAPAGNIAVGVASEIKQHFDDVLGAKDAAAKAAGGSGYNAVPAQSGSAAAAQAFARAHLAQFGWGADQMAPLLALWNQESGWNDNAVNASSGAYGIPQALGKGHPFNLGDYANQVLWGLNYIRDRYGSPAAAEAHEQAFNWYDNGGWLQPGVTMAINNTGQPEPILTGDQWDMLSSASSGWDIGDKLDRIANLLAAQPRATASGVAGALNGTAQMASFRNRYPRNN
jgi:hypothetical protein